MEAGLDCTFYNKVQKKEPNGNRAEELLELRETQQQQWLVQPGGPPSSGLSLPPSSAAAVAATGNSLNLKQDCFMCGAKFDGEKKETDMLYVTP
jgi:hypothetical protein